MSSVSNIYTHRSPVLYCLSKYHSSYVNYADSHIFTRALKWVSEALHLGGVGVAPRDCRPRPFYFGMGLEYPDSLKQLACMYKVLGINQNVACPPQNVRAHALLCSYVGLLGCNIPFHKHADTHAHTHTSYTRMPFAHRR